MTARKPGSTRKPTERHGMTGRRGKQQPPEYQAWAQIIQRCNNQRDPAFKNYGARGIKICDRWRLSFTAFLADVGARPSDKHSIDRIDNNGHYEPGNVRWTTRHEQNTNKRGSRIVNIDGFDEPLTDACARRGVPYNRILHRMTRRGITASEAFALPMYDRKDKGQPRKRRGSEVLT